jgi:hypothetical protein
VAGNGGELAGGGRQRVLAGGERRGEAEAKSVAAGTKTATAARIFPKLSSLLTHYISPRFSPLIPHTYPFRRPPLPELFLCQPFPRAFLPALEARPDVNVLEAWSGHWKKRRRFAPCLSLISFSSSRGDHQHPSTPERGVFRGGDGSCAILDDDGLLDGPPRRP